MWAFIQRRWGSTLLATTPGPRCPPAAGLAQSLVMLLEFGTENSFDFTFRSAGSFRQHVFINASGGNGTHRTNHLAGGIQSLNLHPTELPAPLMMHVCRRRPSLMLMQGMERLG